MRKNASTLIMSVIVILVLLTLVLYYHNRNISVPGSWGVASGMRGSLVNTLNKVLYALANGFIMPSLGVLIQRRHPRHPIGWLLLLSALFFTVTVMFEEFTIYYNFTRVDDLPLRSWVALVQNFIWVIPFALILWAVSIFPDGSLPSKNWRWVHVLILVFVVFTISSAMLETPMASAFQLPNPLAPANTDLSILYTICLLLGIAGLFGAGIGSVILMIFRFSRANGVQRQQLGWLGLTVFLATLIMATGTTLGMVFGLTSAQLLTNFSFSLIPIGIGIAVLRYRLYDLDLIVNRTLVYLALTGLLALIYFGGVVILQSVFRPFLGGSSQVAVVFSTLGIAGLFNPLRERIQRLIDRRFYRRKYDAERSLSKFSSAARQEVSIQRMTASLVAVVDETMEPDKITLWLVGNKTGKEERSSARD